MALRAAVRVDQEPCSCWPLMAVWRAVRVVYWLRKNWTELLLPPELLK